MQFRIKRWIFQLAIKTPVVTLLILFLTFISVWIILDTTYIDLYTELEGKIEFLPNEKSHQQLYITVEIPSTYSGKVYIGQKIIWYINQQDKRYSALVDEITTNTGIPTIWIKIENVKALHNSNIQSAKVQLHSGTQRMINRVFSNSTGA